MIIDPSINEIEEKIPNRFEAAMLIAQRARALNKTPHLTEERTLNQVAQASKEVAQGLISIKET